MILYYYISGDKLDLTDKYVRRNKVEQSPIAIKHIASLFFNKC